MTLEEILKERLTNDKTAKAVEENYRGLIEVQGAERDISQERLIKLNRLERLMTPIKPDKETRSLFPDIKTKFTTYYCPTCREQYYGPSRVKHCNNCGQALDWSEVTG